MSSGKGLKNTLQNGIIVAAKDGEAHGTWKTI
jgi:hypothetical protein